MPKSRAQKEQTVAELTDKLSRTKGAIIVDYKGTKVKDAQKIREESWVQGVDYAVVKKTLLGRALKNTNFADKLDAKVLEGNVAVVLGYKDEIDTAKFAAKYAKELESFKILGGLFEGLYIDANKIKQLASLPGRVELLGKLVGTVQAPISGFVRVLAGNLRGLLQVLNGISAKGGSASG